MRPLPVLPAGRQARSAVAPVTSICSALEGGPATGSAWRRNFCFAGPRKFGQVSRHAHRSRFTQLLRQGWPRVLLWPDARQDPAPRRGPAPPADYAANLGKGFDGRTCSFLRLNYDELKAKTLAGGLTDEQLLAWAEEKGGRRSDEECEVWNSFMMTRGWRDDVVPLLTKRIQESGLGDRTILTMFDYIDFDEGRDPVGSPPWAPKS